MDALSIILVLLAFYLLLSIIKPSLFTRGIIKKRRFALIASILCFLISIIVIVSISDEGNKKNLAVSSEQVKKESEVKEDKVKKTQEMVTEQPKESEQNSSKILEQITAAGGLGDTKEVIEMLHVLDKNIENSSLQASYDGTFYMVLYTGEMASNISLQFESTDKPRRTLEEALQEANKIMPKDARKIKAYDLNDDDLLTTHVVEYRSKTLATRLKELYDLDSTEAPGSFIVIAKGDKEGYFSVVVGWGTNP